jgi:hypothetical protein
MRTRPLKKLLKEQGFVQVPSLEEYEKTTKEFPKKKVWFHDPLCKYWCVNTANGNDFGFDGDFSGYTIGKFHVDLDGEKSAVRLFLCDLFGKVVDADEWSLVSEVKDREQFDKWYNAIAA